MELTMTAKLKSETLVPKSHDDDHLTATGWVEERTIDSSRFRASY